MSNDESDDSSIKSDEKKLSNKILINLTKIENRSSDSLKDESNSYSSSQLILEKSSSQEQEQEKKEKPSCLTNKK